MKMYTKAALVLMTGLLTAAARAQAPSDPQIVGIVVAANQIDIDSGHLALTRSHNKQVREFAQQMITDHTAVQKSVFDLGAKLHVTPAESETSATLKKQASETATRLRTLRGAKFDQAYVDNEVGYHKAVIGAVKTVLIPNAQNSDLKAALEGTAPMFQGHLEHAEQVQAAIGKQSSVSSGR